MIKINIIGAGISGSEIALRLAKFKDFKIDLIDMRPKKMTNAHKTSLPAELVCSNSFRSNNIKNAAGLLKEELRLLKSPLILLADKNKIEGGDSLVVDRKSFQEDVLKKLKSYENINIICDEIKDLIIKDDEIYIVASGPLTSDELFLNLNKLLENESFSFYDGTSPIINSDSINYNIAYFKNRFDKGDNKIYLNFPFKKEEYLNFYNRLLEFSKRYNLDNKNTFQGCLPIEKMAIDGTDTLRFGPFKPVGLDNGSKKNYAVVQLRQDDFFKKMYNIVGFQTGLKEDEQKELVRLIPGLENATFFKYGRLHESRYINSPKILDENFRTKKYSNLYIIGQLTGIEGYIESIATADVAYLDIYYKYILKKEFKLDNKTILGALENYSKNTITKYLPMKSNFGIVLDTPINIKKNDKKEYIIKRSLEKIKEIKFGN